MFELSSSGTPFKSFADALSDQDKFLAITEYVSEYKQASHQYQFETIFLHHWGLAVDQRDL